MNKASAAFNNRAGVSFVSHGPARDVLALFRLILRDLLVMDRHSSLLIAIERPKSCRARLASDLTRFSAPILGLQRPSLNGRLNLSHVRSGPATRFMA